MKEKKNSVVRAFSYSFRERKLDAMRVLRYLFAYLRVKKNLELPWELLFIVMKNADVHIKEKYRTIEEKKTPLPVKEQLVPSLRY